MMVPTGRLELPRIAPLAPQASVSTNSTTSALREMSASGLCFSAPARQPASRAPAPRSRRSARAGAGAGAVVLTRHLVEQRRRLRTRASRCTRYVRHRLLSMKIAANIAVMRDSPVVAPRAPNTVPDAPAPKPAPASAPLPRCNSTSATITKAEMHLQNRENGSHHLGVPSSARAPRKRWRGILRP